MDVRFNFERKRFLVKQLAEIDGFDSLLDDLEQVAMLSRIPYGIPLVIRWQNIELSISFTVWPRCRAWFSTEMFPMSPK